MNFFRTHLYATTIFLVILLIVVGGTIVATRSPVAPSQSSLTWNGGAIAPTYQGPAAAQQSPQEIVQAIVQGPAPKFVSLPPTSTSSQGESTAFQPTSDSIDYVALLAQLSGDTEASTSVSTSQAGANAAITQAYQFIPTGLIATNAPPKKPMTADQKTLYEYGNEVGGEIQSFEQLNPNEAQILKDQAEDRTDPTKIAALVSLGKNIAAVGTYMQQMQDVPTSVTDYHNALAQSYLDIGAKLQLVAQAQSDGAFVQAVQNYDTSAGTFVQQYGTLAQFFTERGVVFSPSDPGSVFSFTNTNGAGNL